MKIYCELCGRAMKEGYLVVSKKTKNHVVCKSCDKALFVEKRKDI